jgi:leader peptidase (prepilin peptidase)/N-methyltransferase
VFQLFRLLTGKEGMGYGDFKLLALFGAWLGWQMLPQIILLSSAIGAIIGVALIALRRHERGKPIPFGPYLILGGLVALFWGEQINRTYLHLTGLG